MWRAACFGAPGRSALFMVRHPEQSSLLGLARAVPAPIALQLHSATLTFQTPRLGQAPIMRPTPKGSLDSSSLAHWVQIRSDQMSALLEF